jgi:hypothetical protein
VSLLEGGVHYELVHNASAEAVRINTDTRLLALKLTFFALAGCALLAYFPAGALPRFQGEESSLADEARSAASSPA